MATNAATCHQAGAASAYSRDTPRFIHCPVGLGGRYELTGSGESAGGRGAQARSSGPREFCSQRVRGARHLVASRRSAPSAGARLESCCRGAPPGVGAALCGIGWFSESRAAGYASRRSARVIGGSDGSQQEQADRQPCKPLLFDEHALAPGAAEAAGMADRALAHRRASHPRDHEPTCAERMPGAARSSAHSSLYSSRWRGLSCSGMLTSRRT